MGFYAVKIKRTISHTIIMNEEAENEEKARDLAMEHVQTKPVNYSQLPPSTIIESHEITAVTRQ